jgi:rhamnulokinase
MKYVLAVDIGASSGRHILGCIKDGKLSIQEVHRFENHAVKKDNHLVWQIDYLFGEIKEGIKKCHQMDIYPESIAIDTWGVDYALLDENGDMIGDAISYRDLRTEGMMEEIFKKIDKKRIYSSTGIQFMHLNTIFQLAAQKKEDASVLDRAKTFLTVPDYLGYLLSGEKYCEYTIASTTQLVDAKKRDWDRELIKDIGVNPDIFPSLVSPGSVVGAVKEDIAPKGMKLVAVGSHDTASAVAAVPAEKENFVYISSGTWALVGVEENEPSLGAKTMEANFTNEGGVGGRIRLLKNLTGMWIIQEIRRNGGKKIGFGEYCELAAKETPFVSLINPDDSSFYSPENMTDAVREYCRKTGQKAPKTDGELARCVFDSMALVYRKTLEELERICAKKFDDIHIIGGGCQNTLVDQIAADVTGRKVIAGPIEATAIGNILMQLITVGELESIESGRKAVANSFPQVEYMPCDKSAEFDKAYERFLALF